MKQTKRILELAGIGNTLEEGKINDAVKLANASMKLGKELSAGGEALKKALAKQTTLEGMVSVIKKQLQADKVKIQAALPADLADNFEESYLDAFYNSFSKGAGITVGNLKKLIGEGALGSHGFAPEIPVDDEVVTEAKYTTLPEGWSDAKTDLSKAIDKAMKVLYNLIDNDKSDMDYEKMYKKLDSASTAIDKAFNRIP